MKHTVAIAMLLALWIMPTAAAEEGLPANPVTHKVNFDMKYDSSFGGIFLNNADFVDYLVELDWVDGAIHLSYTTVSGHDGKILPAGAGVTMPVRTGMWRIIGDNGLELAVDVSWGSVVMVSLLPYGDETAVGMEAKTEDRKLPLMARVERPAEYMPRRVELPPQQPSNFPIRHPFGINRPSGKEVMEYMRENEPERYAEMMRQFHERQARSQPLDAETLNRILEQK